LLGKLLGRSFGTALGLAEGDSGDTNLARHGKDKEEKERLQCISEITVYYNYRDDGKLGQLDADSIFYNTLYMST